MAFKDAGPCPPGISRSQWVKAFNAADSRMYRKMGKDAGKSTAARTSGETRRLAIEILAQSVPSSVQTSSAVPTSATHQSAVNVASQPMAKAGGVINGIRFMQGSSKVFSKAVDNHNFSSAATTGHQGEVPVNSMATLPQKRKLAPEGMHSQRLQKRGRASPPEDQGLFYTNVLDRKLTEVDALWAAIDEAETAALHAKAKVQDLYHQLKSATAEMRDAIENSRLHRLRNDPDPREN